MSGKDASSTGPGGEAFLVLEDGAVYRGTAFGKRGEAGGEVVFNTSMYGYQEVLTDPSYKGQMVAMTYPHIGNYGVNDEDAESEKPQVEGFIVRELSRRVSNFRSNEDLHSYLARHGVVGITGVDTRSLTRRLRSVGALNGVLSSVDLDVESLKKKARAVPKLEGRDLVKEVTCRESSLFDPGYESAFAADFATDLGRGRRVVAVDYGAKRNILRSLRQCGFEVVRVPATTTAREILAHEPDGVFLSNGPGDPAAVTYGIEALRGVLETPVPVFGICLGHQLLGHAFGGKTFKLKFGHHGGNQPVMDLTTGQVEITAQNHGFAVDPQSVDPNEIEITHVNLNDRTVEGMRHRKRPVFSVQYHPEAAPGPHDSLYLFRRFAEMVARRREKAGAPR